MWVMTHDAFSPRMMFFRVDAWDFTTNVLLVREIGMAADTERATAINVQSDWIIGMIVFWTVAVFTTDGTMGRVLDIVILVFMTFPAGLVRLVFCRELLPVGLVRFAVPAIHITPLMGTKVIWD